MGDPKGYVYFIREGQDGPIKIGTTQGSPHTRQRAMQTGNSSDLVLLAAIPGDVALEKRLHERFAAVRMRGEWFEATAELLAFVEGLLFTHPLPKDLHDDAPIFGDMSEDVLEKVRGYLLAADVATRCRSVSERASQALLHGPSAIASAYSEALRARQVVDDLENDSDSAAAHGNEAFRVGVIVGRATHEICDAVDALDREIDAIERAFDKSRAAAGNAEVN